MAQSLASVPLHIVFSTKDRIPFIQSNIEDRVYAYLAATCNKIGCKAYEINGMSDHVHLLVLLSRTMSISDLLETIKSNSSRWIKTLGKEYRDFSWQRGFGAFASDWSTIDGVKKYIVNQKEHHKVRYFKKEYILLLKRYGVEYDERYLWD